MDSCIRLDTVEGSLGGAIMSDEWCQLALKKGIDSKPDEQTRKLHQSLSEGEVKKTRGILQNIQKYFDADEKG